MPVKKKKSTSKTSTSKLLSTSEQTQLESLIKECKLKNKSIWLTQFDIGKSIIRVLRENNDCLFLNKDGHYILFDLISKDLVDCGAAINNKIQYDSDIPWTKVVALKNRLKKTKNVETNETLEKPKKSRKIKKTD